jgi:uncharacterized protein (TIGR02099 family)
MKWLLRAIEGLAWALFFAFAALLLTLRYWVLPDIERYRDDIVAVVSSNIGQPVRIGAIEAGWIGLRPQLSLFDVRVYDAAGREALVLPAVDNVISWRSLLRGQLHLHSLVIDRPRLGVRRDTAGDLYVAGIKLTSARSDSRLVDWILAQEEIVISGAEIEWRDDKRGAPPLALSALDLRLQSSGRDHSLGVAARPPAALGSVLDLRVEFSGESPMQLSAWNGRLYLEIGATDLAGWRSWVDYPVDVRQGQGALRLWATLEKGQPKQATLDLELARVVARLGKDLPPLALASLRGRIQALERAGGYELAGRQLALAAAQGPAMSPADFRIAWQPAGNAAEHGSAVANVVELEPLAHLAESLPFPAELRKRLAELAPRGRILDAKVAWTGPIAAPVQYNARARFAGLAAQPGESLPGFSGLAGTFDLNEVRGSAHVAARKAELDLPRVLSEPVLLDSLDGRVAWERKGERAFSIKLDALSFANEHLEGKASGIYSNPGEGRGEIDLSAQLSRADGRYVARYLPLGSIMGQGLRDWLAAAILAGQASDARLRLKGDLRDFPFVDASKGEFRVSARVEKGELDYVAGWPRIYDIDAQLLFEREKMEIVGRSATILGAKLANVRVGIPKLAPGAHLLVSGHAEGPTGEFLKYVESSPVRRMIGGFSDGMSAVGRGKLALKLDVPLAEPDATKLAGEYEFLSNTLLVHPHLPPLERATGKLGFTESSSTVQEVRGRIFEGAVTLTGGSRAGLGVEVIAKGDATVAGIQPLFNHPWRRFLSGSAAYTATVALREGRTRIIVESTLRGVASALPPPLSKGVADALPLRVEVLPAEGGTRDRLSVSLARLAQAEFLRRKQGEAMVVQRASIWLSPGGPAPGGEPMRLPERPGTLVYGTLEVLDADRWTALVSSGESVADSVSLDLKIGTLDAYGSRLHDIAMRAGADATGWSATVDAKELAGDVAYRSERGGQLIARLKHFAMPEDSPGARPQEPGRTRDLPSVDLAAERFEYKGKQLGRVEVVAQRSGQSWRIEKLTMVNPDAALTGRGSWQTAPQSQTALEFQLDSSDAGKFLERIGYPNLVRGSKAHMQGALTWSGAPTAPDYPSISGEVQMQADDGQFLEIEPGIGKLVSLMSLQALPRRLTLDFRDVFSKGFQFDRIASAAGVARGVMTVKEFKMRGSAAQVDMTGEVDLAKETQNLQVRVVPSLGDSASTVLAILNPLLVFPAAIAQKILKDPLGHIFAFDYSITGSWADPKVAKTRAAAQEAPGAADK